MCAFSDPMMHQRGSATLWALLSVAALACASGCMSEVQDASKEPAGDNVARGRAPSASAEDDVTTAPEACVPHTCETLGAKAGSRSDGCGGTIDCGPTDTCTPKTCQELGKTSGTVDDGCGKTLDCGPACADAKAGNTSNLKAFQLAPMSDSPNSKVVVADLKLADGEEDWFKFKVTDAGFGGNPQIDASVTLAGAQVSVFYVCDSQPDYSTCVNAGDTADATVGKGCRGVGKVGLATECSGISENGTAFVRIKKAAADAQCAQYTLTVTVE